jgi:leucyl/phenylalanyl-tRNA--protein transferase
MTARTECVEIRTAVSLRRDAIFHETPAERLRRLVLGCAWAVKPERAGGLPNLLRLWLTDLANPDTALPHPTDALESPAGLCGIARDLSAPMLVEAYRRGLYPFAHIAPLKWWSPPERWVLFFEEFHVARRLRGYLRQGRFRVTFDRDFDAVMKACAAPRPGKWHLTWITPALMRAYADLHDAGYAHSYEVWNEAGELVGGGYGVAVGRSFTIESRFVRASNASKVGLAVLHWHLAQWGFAFIDNKVPNQNIIEMGFRGVPRADFVRLLADAANAPSRMGRWRVEADPQTVADWRPGNAKADDELLLDAQTRGF